MDKHQYCLSFGQRLAGMLVIAVLLCVSSLEETGHTANASCYEVPSVSTTRPVFKIVGDCPWKWNIHFSHPKKGELFYSSLSSIETLHKFLVKCQENALILIFTGNLRPIYSHKNSFKILYICNSSTVDWKWNMCVFFQREVISW